MIITIKTLNITEDLNIIDHMTGDKHIIEEENHHLDHKAEDVEAIHLTIQDQCLQQKRLKKQNKIINQYFNLIILNKNRFNLLNNYKKQQLINTNNSLKRFKRKKKHRIYYNVLITCLKIIRQGDLLILPEIRISLTMISLGQNSLIYDK